MNPNTFHSIKTKLILLIALQSNYCSCILLQIKTIENRVNSLAQIASYSVASAIYFNDEEATNEQITALIKSEDIEYVIIQTPQDSTYYSYNLALAKKDRYLDSNSNAISQDKLVYKTKIKIEINNEIIGELFLGYSLKQLNIDMANLRTKIAWVSVIIFIIGLIAVYFIGTYITYPITKMVETVEKIRGGDLTKRTEVLKNDEIGYLSKSLNSMVDRIE